MASLYFNHNQTGLPALCVSTESYWEKDENAHRINEYADIPDFDYSKEFPIPKEVSEYGYGFMPNKEEIKNKGELNKKALFNYFKAFIDFPDFFYLIFFKSNFPKKEV